MGTPAAIEISSTFDGLRYPATCPAGPHSVAVAADSYVDSTVRTAAAPLAVTGCASLPYSPAFAVTLSLSFLSSNSLLWRSRDRESAQRSLPEASCKIVFGS